LFTRLTIVFITIGPNVSYKFSMINNVHSFELLLHDVDQKFRLEFGVNGLECFYIVSFEVA
jgi:hypothetical protein